MKHLQYGDNPTIAILIKSSYINDKDIKANYIDRSGLDCYVFELTYNDNNKVTTSQAKKYITNLLSSLTGLGIKTLYVCDSTYFKVLTNQKKAEPHIGYVLNCAIKNYEHIAVIYGVNYGQLLYNPNLYSKLDLTLDTLKKQVQGSYKDLGSDVIQSASYDDARLYELLNKPMLSCDIETTGLQLGSKLVSIAFAWDKHNGIAFKVTDKTKLKQFFERYTGYLIFHNATFDIKHIIYNLFDNQLHGLHTMYKHIHDTKIIAYLATNNTQGNTLGLKDLAHEYVGNYAVDVTDITKLSDNELLEYNLIDTLATWYVFDKYYSLMLKDNQEGIYKNLMLPSLKIITQMELTGMPMDMSKVHLVKDELEEIKQSHLAVISNSKLIDATVYKLKLSELDKRNAKLKTKQLTINDIHLDFNPSSNKHLQVLLYDVLNLPILDFTDSKQPATGSATLDKLLNHCDENNVQLLTALIGLNKVDKILTTFIPAFLKAKPRDNWHYLHGNFNMGGTLSGRMSSSNPNLQNLPSGSTYGKLIKTCFKAPKGFVMCGADFSSLEDRINALLTKDPNKLKVYTDGFDGHCLRAYYYWGDKMPDIENTVESINSIKYKYPKLRQASKAPTFALTYGGQYFTLMNNCGFTEIEAKAIEANYHKMYEISDNWVADKINQAEKDGYIDSAFGLRIRTPVIGLSVLGNSKTPYIATAEARSVGNAISGQSYGLLTNRAINAFMELVWASEYKNDIYPISLIHDAIYLMIKDDINVVKFVNDNLIKCMQWQELKEIKHDEVTLEAELDLFYPDWANPITLPNNISRKQIKEIVKNNI